MINPNKLNEKNENFCSFSRRLGAIVYDTVLLITVFYCATYVLVPFLGGEAIESNNLAYKIYLLILAYLYFVWHWCFGGKTLGMRSWQIKIVNDLGIKTTEWAFINSAEDVKKNERIGTRTNDDGVDNIPPYATD